MNLEIITPDKNVFKGEVVSATFPGINGRFQLLKDHAPLVSTLAQGDLVLEQGQGKSQTFVIDGGVIEVSNNKVLVLAEAVE